MADQRVLVLGASGMLGATVHAWLSSCDDVKVQRTLRPAAQQDSPTLHFDVESFANSPEKYPWLEDHAWIINCIGVLKADSDEADVESRERAILVNASFPHLLARTLEGTQVRVIQIASDGVFSGRKGSYHEDDPHDADDLYGRTKSLGEVPSPRFLHIRCSIVGRDRKRRRGLLEWLLAQASGVAVPGFTHHRWSGVTTLQFAKLCHHIVSRDGWFDELTSISPVHHFVPNGSCSKRELLETMNRVYGANVHIRPTADPPPAVDRSLKSRFDELEAEFGTSSLEAALEELRSWHSSGLGRG